MNKIVFATNNMGKLSEIKKIVEHHPIEILSLSEINCKDNIPETGITLKENALQKATFIFNNYGHNCFADDTGLEVRALSGMPGVYSARYAGPECNADKNMEKLLNNLRYSNDRSAVFRTVIVSIIDGEINYFEGSCDGIITKENIGIKGFGYDPIFMPVGQNLTFAEMSIEEKSLISHRGKAVRKFCNFLKLMNNH